MAKQLVFTDGFDCDVLYVGNDDVNNILDKQAHVIVGSYNSVDVDGLTMLVLHVPFMQDHYSDHEHYTCLEELTILNMFDEVITLDHDKNKQDHELFENVKLIIFMQITVNLEMKVTLCMSKNTAKYLYNKLFKSKLKNPFYKYDFKKP